MFSQRLRILLNCQQSCRCVELSLSNTVSVRVRSLSSDRGKVADRFSWLLSESHNTGVVEGLKKTYRLGGWSN